ncbi:MAG: autoinducer binding domain-containing protein [Rubrivivax sp.]|nr:autoinducer binding domain-containing protein [Rubrivivax sp.]MDP3222740.1 autoinducer binding domain-containing protein [Rubrivivax sp.]MDP3615517.1 autoinducer binding domain-containing protein [Rubrivivax sp.]
MRYQDYQDVGASPDLATFERRLLSFAQKMDFGIVSAALAVDQPGEKPLFVMIGNTPQAFVDASRNFENVQRDPVMRRLKSSSRPFVYDQSLYIEEDAADLWEEQAPFGYRTGISMALHMPAGRHFLLGVDRESPLPSEDHALTRLMADLQLLAVYAQETAVRVLLPEAQPESPLPHLTQREKEVLRWTREGKSAWSVGQILSMSEHTANYHLRNAMRKLGVSSKHIAILKAQSLGLI